MKPKLILLLVLILLFGVFVAVRFFILNGQTDYGELKILSSPTTNIFIDNAMIGKTPFDQKYKIGEYLLKLIPEGTATETASWQGKISIFKSALTYVNRELGASDLTSAGEIFTSTRMTASPQDPNNGAVSVDSDPEGAIVYLDNDEKGVAPLILQDVPKGDHELSVFMPGFFRRTQKINVDPDYQVNAMFKLAMDMSQQQASQSAQLNNSPSTSQAPAATISASTASTVLIKDTPQGWLRVRADATITASEEAKIKPGGKYPYVDTKDGWYEIKFNGDAGGLVSGSFDTGWVSAEFATLQ